MALLKQLFSWHFQGHFFSWNLRGHFFYGTFGDTVFMALSGLLFFSWHFRGQFFH